MFGENLAFSQIATIDADAAWKMLERSYQKGNTEQFSGFVGVLDDRAPMWSAAAGSVPHRQSFFTRLIKSGDVDTISKVLAKGPNPETAAQRLGSEFFGTACESRNEAVCKLLFPETAKIEFSHKQWEVALLRKNMHLLERMAFKVETKRGLAFIDNYFFDLQLAQLKYLDKFIDQKAWPMKFVKDAILRQKGPGMISFFLDKAGNATKISAGDTWDSIAAAIRTDNVKALGLLVGMAQNKGAASFDWGREGSVGDFPLLGDDDIKLQMMRMPHDYRKMTLLEFSVLRGVMHIAQDILDVAGSTPQQDRIDGWKESIIKTLKASGVKTDKANKVWAQIDGDMQFLKMQESALNSKAKAKGIKP